MFPRWPTALLAIQVAAFCPLATAQDTPTVYRGATIYPGDGPPIENGVLITAQGRIQTVGGASTAIPEGAEIIDVSNRVITPGLIDAAWAGGVASNDRNEQAEEVTPAMNILDSLDPQARSFQRARADGVTSVHVMPGTRNVIGGLSAVIKTAGSSASDMLVRDEATLRIVLGAEPSGGNRAIRGGRIESIYYRRPTTRMGVVWAVRSSFYDAKDHMAKTVADGDGPPDPGMAVLANVLRGELTAVTTARSEQDLRTALRLADEFGYRTVLDEAQDAHYVIDELQDASVWVMVGAPSAETVGGGGSRDGARPRYSTLRKLAAADIPFVITTGTNSNALSLAQEAMFAVRYGLDPEEALAAITSRPAQLLGVDDRVGSLKPGLDADFVIWSKDPFDPTSRPLTVLVDGTPTVTPR